MNFPQFSLARLLKTVFDPQPGESICVLIDLEDPKEITEFGFLTTTKYFVQKHAYQTFYRGLHDGVLNELGLKGGDIFAYKKVGGSNLDMPDVAYSPSGAEISLERDVYKVFDIVLCISKYSATAPLTEFAKKYGFRGATLHGVNTVILNSGLSVDYNEVSKTAEKLRLGLTKADWVEIDFKCLGESYKLKIDLAKQEAQKSHGLCKEKSSVANLPAGEIYFVPTNVSGSFPMKYEDGTLGEMMVTGGRILQAKFLKGNMLTIDDHNRRLKDDPFIGVIGELGFGTQNLPVAGSDIQDEKILGTFHVATGRSDHLGGDLTPDKFANRKNAAHDDILYAPHKTPEIEVPQVRMLKNNEVTSLIENYVQTGFIDNLIK